MQFTARITVRAPIDGVFEYLADQMQWPSIGLVREQLPPGPIGRGTVFAMHATRKRLDMFTTIREFDPPRRIGLVRETEGKKPYVHGYTLFEQGDKTLIVSDAEWDGLGRLPALDPIWFFLYQVYWAVGSFVSLQFIRRHLEHRA